MKSFLLPELRAFLRYTDLPGESSTNVYLAGLILAAQPSFLSIITGHPALAASRSILVDLLGSGFSDAPAEFSYSLEDHARTIANLLDHLGLRDINLIGYSMSGAVAITLAAVRPDLIARLVLLEANLDPMQPDEGKVSSQIASQSEAEFCTHGYQAIVDSLQQLGLEGNETMAIMAGMMQTAAPPALYRSAIHLVNGTRPTVRERLMRMTIPRTYIFGQRSLPDPDWQVLAQKGIQVLAVDSAGHGMAWDNPRGVAEAIDKGLSYSKM